jgi:hypothetical protein
MPVPESMSGVLWFAAGGGTELHLYSEPPADAPRSPRHPCLRVSRLDLLLDRVRAVGAEVIEPPVADIPGRRRFFVIDPFGNAVEFAAFETASDG